MPVRNLSNRDKLRIVPNWDYLLNILSHLGCVYVNELTFKTKSVDNSPYSFEFAVYLHTWGVEGKCCLFFLK